MYVLGDTKLYIGGPAHATSYGHRALFETRNGKIALVGEYQAYGLDNYARVVTHEFTHKQMWDLYHARIVAAASNGIPDGDKNPDGTMADPDADPDGDGIPNFYEEQVGLDPTKFDSTGFDGNGGYGGDSEAIARWTENNIGLAPDRTTDWASDGLNYGSVLNQNYLRIFRFGLDGTTPLP